MNSHYKNGTSDFETKIAYVNNTLLTFHYHSHKYQLGEAGAAG